MQKQSEKDSVYVDNPKWFKVMWKCNLLLRILSKGTFIPFKVYQYYKCAIQTQQQYNTF